MAQVLGVVRATGRVAAWAEARISEAERRGASMVSKEVCGFLGVCGTAATGRGVEGWTLGLRGERPNAEMFYV